LISVERNRAGGMASRKMWSGEFGVILLERQGNAG